MWPIRCFSLLLLVNYISAAKILYIALTPSPSHTIWDKTLAYALKEKHQITFLSHGPPEKVKSSENFTSWIVNGAYEKLHEDFDLETLFDLSDKEQVDILFEWMNWQSDFDAESKDVADFIKKVDEGLRFDLVIWDLTTGHLLYPLIEKLGYPPVIVTSAFGLNLFFTFSFGTSLHTSYIPLWMMPYTDQMTFTERLRNNIVSMYALYVRQYQYMPHQIKLAEKLFGNNFTSFDEIEKRFSFILANTDPILDYPQSLPPQVIPVGGLHIKRVDVLPQDLKTYLDNSKNGVILMCLGTNVRSDSLLESQKKALIEAFGRLKQNVIWKYESDIEGLPKNVIARKWVPQNEILAHPNVKLFLSHGGGLSTQEAQYHGVPVVGLPFFADQIVNMNKFTARKLGLTLQYGSLTADNVYNALSEVLNNPVYLDSMKAISKRFRDQPQNPLERAVFWVEYALRQGGAEHLRVATRDMSFVQTNNIDILALFITVVALVFYIIYKCVTGRNKQCKITKNKKLE